MSARASHLVVRKDRLMINEWAFSGQAIDGISPAVTNFFERKSMSTKTTFKRLALVTAVALGLGGVSAVSAHASTATLSTEYVTSISASTNTAPVAGITGSAVEHTFVFKTSTTAQVHIQPNVILAGAPATSTLAPRNLAATVPLKGEYSFVNGAVSGTTWGSTTAFDDTTSSAPSASTNGIYSYAKAYLDVRYDVAGTYTWVVWDDLNADGAINGSEYSTTYTVVVAANSASAASGLVATVAPVNSTAAAAGTYGSLVKITLKDASGNPVNPDSAGGIKVSVSGSAKVAAVNVSTSNTTSSYTLGTGAFNGSGVAYVNITDATAETVALTLSGVGSATSFVGPGSTALVFKTSAGASAAVGVTATAPTTNTASTVRFSAAGGSVTSSFITGNYTAATATAVYDDVQVVDVSGKIVGLANAGYDLAVAEQADNTTAAFSLTSAFTAAGQTYTVGIGGHLAQTITATIAALSSVAWYLPTAGYKTAAGTAQSVVVKAKDNFGAGLGNVSITPSISGRNSALVLSTLVTDSSGKATFAYTDASTSTTSLTDTLSFAGSYTDVAGTTTTVAGSTNSAAISYTSAANLGVTKIVVATPQTDATGADLPNYVASTIDTTDGAQSTLQSVKATVTDVNGNPVSGVPVVFTVSGTGAAVLSTKKTVYSASDGTATASVYGWVSGSYSVTATVGTVTKSANIYFASNVASNTRNVAATVSGNLVTVKVTDRFGNPVKGASISATTSAGYFGTGASSVSALSTDSNGSVVIALLGNPVDATVTVSVDKTSATYSQTLAPAGNYDAVAGDTYTASVAGTATTAEVGVGASYAPAGNSSASVTVSAGTDGTSVATSAAQAAVDAANEATDAANAATDAANNAMDSADAAQQAALDAGDKADAALAAVTDLATKVSAIASQIASLSALVKKIAAKVKA